jgi:uncharacterized membrane protein HdeD (DUF308 family)
MSFLMSSNPDAADFHRNSGCFLTWGIVLVLLGLLAISYTTFTTIVSVIVLGAVLTLSGFFMILDAFTFWRGKWLGFFWFILFGLLYFFAGYVLISGPMAASISLTLMLAIIYIVLGAVRIISSISLRTPFWGWNLFNGVITFTLGLLIMSQWPMSGIYIIGLFIGIDLIFSGWAYIMAALGSRALMKR